MPTAIRAVTSALVADDRSSTTKPSRPQKAAGSSDHTNLCATGDDKRRMRSSTVVEANDDPPSDEASADAAPHATVVGSSEPDPQGDDFTVNAPSSKSKRGDPSLYCTSPRVIEPGNGTPQSTECSSPRKIQGVPSGQEMYEQWDALVEREVRYEAFSVQRHIGPADRWRETHLVCIHDIVDDYGIDSSMVSAAFALFDRYFARGLVLGGEWSLALMTCLFLAIKINSSCNNGELMIDASTMSWECSSQFTSEQIFDMERRVCRDFDWRLNPPIPEIFIDLLASYLTKVQVASDEGYYYPTSTDEDYIVNIPTEMRQELVKQSKQLCGMSVLDRNFVCVRPSSIAHAAVMVAMDIMHFPVGASRWFASLPLECNPDETKSYIARLHQLCSEEDHTPTKLFVFPSFSSGNDRTSSGDDDDDDTDISSLTKSDTTPSVSEETGNVATCANDEEECHEVGCEDAPSAMSSKRRRIR